MFQVNLLGETGLYLLKQFIYGNIQILISILPMTFAAYTLNKKNPISLKYVMESDCY